MNAFVELSENPYTASNIKKLQGLDHAYRKRVGDYRIIYSIEDTRLIVAVLKIDSRGDVYKK